MLGIIQAISSVILSLVGITLAFLVYKIQRDRNTAKLVMVSDKLIEGEEHDEPSYAIRTLNVGLVPAISVRFLVDIEEWQDGRKIRSTFQEEGFVAFSDTIPLLAPQDSQLYKLPTPEDKSYIFTATVACRYGTGDRARFLTIGNSSDPASDQIAFRHVEEGRSTAMQRLESRGRADSSTGHHFPRMHMGATSLKDYNVIFGADKE